MSRRTRFARWSARAVVAAAAAAAAHSGLLALRDSRDLSRYALGCAAEPIESAQGRLFGRKYMASVRAVTEKVDASQTLLFVDDDRSARDWSYFALYHLAPRRLERLGTMAELERGKFEKRIPKWARWVLLIPGDGAPLRLVEPRDLQRRNYGARQAPP